MEQQEESTVAVLTLVTSELRNLYDKLLLGAYNTHSGGAVGINAVSQPPPLNLGDVADSDAEFEIAFGLQSIVGFIIADNVQRMRKLCQSNLLASMQVDNITQYANNVAKAKQQSAPIPAAGVANKSGANVTTAQQALKPLSPSKAVYDTIVRVTEQLEALLSFVTRSHNGAGVGAGVPVVGGGYQQNLTPEQINEVTLYVLGEIILTLNNILQQTASVMQTVEQLNTAVEGGGVVDGDGMMSNLSTSMQKLLTSLDAGTGGNLFSNSGLLSPSRSQGALGPDLDAMRSRRAADTAGGNKLRESSNSIADQLAAFEADVASGSKNSPPKPSNGSSSPRSVLGLGRKHALTQAEKNGKMKA